MAKWLFIIGHEKVFACLLYFRFEGRTRRITEVSFHTVSFFIIRAAPSLHSAAGLGFLGTPFFKGFYNTTPKQAAGHCVVESKCSRSLHYNIAAGLGFLGTPFFKGFYNTTPKQAAGFCVVEP